MPLMDIIRDNNLKKVDKKNKDTDQYIDIPILDVPVLNLSAGQKQKVEISRNSEIPTTSTAPTASVSSPWSQTRFFHSGGHSNGGAGSI